ncbi:hypothetical protein BDN72DRAFT_958722 [Pluteus cervinus]|uniref:Uncharacterized protein n=1 Tax=Pluteus cervinus TaxID=181527 RepID=A0ACD3AYU2_9AGAR|nr:hypothetical protein BDN72DRAFT_958722 [Pluteus cervinus]
MVFFDFFFSVLVLMFCLITGCGATPVFKNISSAVLVSDTTSSVPAEAFKFPSRIFVSLAAVGFIILVLAISRLFGCCKNLKCRRFAVDTRRSWVSGIPYPSRTSGTGRTPMAELPRIRLGSPLNLRIWGGPMTQIVMPEAAYFSALVEQYRQRHQS